MATQKPYETHHGYLALHALMIHIWNLDEALNLDQTKDDFALLSEQKQRAIDAVELAFGIDANDIIPDEDWDMANMPYPYDYPYIITTIGE